MFSDSVFLLQCIESSLKSHASDSSLPSPDVGGSDIDSSRPSFIPNELLIGANSDVQQTGKDL